MNPKRYILHLLDIVFVIYILSGFIELSTLPFASVSC